MSAIQNPVSFAWLFLVIATGLSGWLAETHRGVFWASVVVALVAAAKIDVIMQHFMEVKGAPMIWRTLMRSWLVAATCIAGFGVAALTRF